MSWQEPAWPVEASHNELAGLGRLAALEAQVTRAMWFALRPIADLSLEEWREWKGRKLRSLTAEMLRHTPAVEELLHDSVVHFDELRGPAQKKRRVVLKLILADPLRHGDGCIYARHDIDGALHAALAAMTELTFAARVVHLRAATLISKGQLQERPATERGPTMKIGRQLWRI